jgi:hypothetical protein
VSGYPGRPHSEAKRIYAHMQRLPQYVGMIQDLQKKVERLEKKIDEKKSSRNKKT